MNNPNYLPYNAVTQEGSSSSESSASRFQIVASNVADPISVETDHPTVPNKRRAKHQLEPPSSKKHKPRSVTNNRSKKRTVDFTQIRVSLKVLIEAVSNLTEPQREWVRQSGFGCFLDFKIKDMPHKLGFKIVKAFKPGNFTLSLPGGNISITEYDVADVLGFPHGDKKIDLTSKNPERSDAWSAQFGLTKSNKFKVSAKMVVDAIEKEEAVTELLKLNFMMIIYNCLIETPGTPFLNKKMLNFTGSLDELSTYNWPSLVLRSLADTKDVWEADPAIRMYTGPLLFLIVSLCYLL